MRITSHRSPLAALLLLAALGGARAAEGDAAATPPPAAEPASAQAPAEAAPAEAATAPAATADASATATIPVQAVPENTAPPPEEKAKKNDPTQLGEVVVTAQKTKQSARRVPVSVTAISGDFIKKTGAATLADVSLYVPNARVDAHDLGSPQVFIRGFGTNAFNPAFESSVAFVQDDLFFGRPGYFTESMYDIDRVEVLRGPQGTLFGKNTIAGVFNVLTKGAQGEPSGDAQVFYGEHNEKRIDGGFGGMLGEKFGARLGFLYRDVGGETTNSFLERREDAAQQKAMRGKFRWQPFELLSTELTLSTSRTSAPFWPYQLFKLDDDTRTYLQNFDPKVEDNPKDFRTEFDTAGWIKKGSDTGTLRTELDLAGVGSHLGFTGLNATLILGGSGFFIDQLNELDISPADIARLDSHEDHDQQSAELRFSGKAEHLFGLGAGFEVVGGLFHYQSNYKLLARVLAGKDFGSYLTTKDAAQLATAGTPAAPLGSSGGLALPGLGALSGLTAPLLTDNDYYQFNYRQHDVADAIYAQATWKLTKKLAIVPGLRLGIETKTVDVVGHGYCPSKNATGGALPASTCVIQTLLKGEDYEADDQQRKEYDFSPKIALQYFADYGVNYYASFGKAAKSGGFNALALNTQHLQFQGEKATTYEMGAKGRFFNKTLNANLAVYQTDFRNLQVLAFNGVAFDVGNAAAVSRGIEGDFQWVTPYKSLKILGSMGLLDAHYTRYTNGPAPISQGIGATADLTGRRVAFAPRGTATLTPVLSLNLPADLLLTVSGDAIYQGNQYTDTDLDPNVYVPSYMKYNARIIFSDASEKWSLSIGGNNLGDKRVLNQVIDTIFFPGTYQAQQASGRQLFVQFGTHI